MPHVHHHPLARWLCGLIALAGCAPTTSTPEPDTPPAVAQRSDPLSDECVAPGCGNGALEAYEACDDGNTKGGDGCSATCLREQAEPKPAGVIRLQNRTLSPAEAIDPALVAAAAEAPQPYLHAMAVFDERPDSEAPAAWAEAGIELAGYIHAEVYIVKLPLTETADGEPMDEAGFEALRVRLGAKHLVAFAPGDRADEATQAGDLPDWAVDPATGLAHVLVLVYGGVPAHDRDALIEGIQAGDEPAVLASEALVAVTTPVEALPTLLASPLVEWIEPGPHPADELMDAVRANLGVTNADRPSLCLTGAGVRLATVAETAQANHPDFYTYDVNGVQGASRLLAGAAGGGTHGTHVIGIMAGNGWLSQALGGRPFQWRGVAPEAQVTDAEWYSASPTGVRPHAAGSSTVPIGFDGFYDAGLMDMDARIRGDAHLGHFYTQLWAAGNNGGGYAGGATGQGSGSGTRGNYAVVATGKNTISVANIFAEDFRWASSSMGPSHDGRIKPEVAAPGCRLRHPYQDVAFEVEYLRVVRPAPGDADLNYDFEGPTMDGWYPWQMWREKATGPTKVASPGGHAARFMLTGPRPLVQWSKYEVAAGERTIHDYFNGTYGGLSKANDEIHLRYRYAGGEPLFEGGHILLWWFWNLTDANPNNDQVRYLEVPIRADGAWDTIVLPASALGDWAGHPIDTLRLSPGAPNPGAVIAAGEISQYAGMCGTSMASPAATGVVGLLLEELATTRGVDLDDPLSPSPFAWGSPGTGRPLPSTFRALLVHSARDLARVARIGDTNGADTGEPPSYHKGPDYTMGYGAVDAEEAVRVLQENAAGNLPIYERQAAPATTQVFNLTVPPNQRAPLKVTLAWSDPGISPTGLQHEKKLVNDLDLELRAPSGAVHRPWSIDLPYIPYSCPTCLPPQAVGDEPVTTADFVPARNDLKNSRDNLEMVYVETPEAGVWQVRVSVPPLPTGPQKYSIILGQPAPRPTSWPAARWRSSPIAAASPPSTSRRTTATRPWPCPAWAPRPRSRVVPPTAATWPTWPGRPSPAPTSSSSGTPSAPTTTSSRRPSRATAT
ncbi:MAG: S8 family serine peptidase [bacterium]